MGDTYLVIEAQTTEVSECSIDPQGVSLSLDSGRLNIQLQGRDRSGLADFNLEPRAVTLLRATIPDKCAQSQDGTSGAIAASLVVDGVDVAVRGTEIPSWVADCSGIAFAVDPQMSGQDDGTGPYVDLVASVAPSGSSSNGWLSYSLVLTNTGASDFTFHGCPGFTEELFSDHEKVETSRYALNCDGVGDIKPGQAVAFDMRIQDESSNSQLAVTWIMDNGPSVSAQIEE